MTTQMTQKNQTKLSKHAKKKIAIDSSETRIGPKNRPNQHLKTCPYRFLAGQKVIRGVLVRRAMRQHRAAVLIQKRSSSYFCFCFVPPEF